MVKKKRVGRLKKFEHLPERSWKEKREAYRVDFNEKIRERRDKFIKSYWDLIDVFRNELVNAVNKKEWWRVTYCLGMLGAIPPHAAKEYTEEKKKDIYKCCNRYIKGFDFDKLVSERGIEEARKIQTLIALGRVYRMFNYKLPKGFEKLMMSKRLAKELKADMGKLLKGTSKKGEEPEYKCRGCGENVAVGVWACPNCGKEVLGDFSIHVVGRAKYKYSCPTCAASLKEEDIFCPNCGEKFVGDGALMKVPKAL